MHQALCVWAATKASSLVSASDPRARRTGRAHVPSSREPKPPLAAEGVSHTSAVREPRDILPSAAAEEDSYTYMSACERYSPP